MLRKLLVISRTEHENLADYHRSGGAGTCGGKSSWSMFQNRVLQGCHSPAIPGLIAGSSYMAPRDASPGGAAATSSAGYTVTVVTTTSVYTTTSLYLTITSTTTYSYTTTIATGTTTVTTTTTSDEMFTVQVSLNILL